MGYREYIRSKFFEDERMFDLFEACDRDNPVESLIDYIADKMSKNVGAESKIHDLEAQVDIRDEKIKELRGIIESYQEEANREQRRVNIRHKTFKSFINDFTGKNDRYPSINEAWDTAWDSSDK